MKVSVSWLKDFVDIPAGPQELKATLTQVGLGVESVSSFDGGSILEVEITTNRPDCLNHYGVAREVATAYRVPLKKVEVVFKEYGPPVTEQVSIEIRDPDLCARYCSRVIRHLQVKPSPEWLVKRLAAVGAPSINNVTDVTNYVLLELGHPLHAFDLDQVRQRRILVRRARAGEHLKTLDGVDRTLNPDNLVIADGERAIALAGVMGGAESGIREETTSVLLESAWFDPLSIRRTAKAQAMHTEASHRFERGADIEMAPFALDRATELIAQLAGGELLRGKLDVYPRPLRREKIDLRRSEIERILGAEILWEDVERILRSLSFLLERRGTEGWRVIPPSFRLDVTREVDLIEEVARHFGYDRLPARLLPAPPRTEHHLVRQREAALTHRLEALGYHEIKTSPMVDPSGNARFSARPSVIIQNPLSQEASVLRTSAIPSMLAAIRWNLDRGQEDLRFFEVGKAYWKEAHGPRERQVLALGVAGYRRPATVHDNARELDFFDLKGDLEALLGLFEIQGLHFAILERAEEPDGAAEIECSEWEGFALCGTLYLAQGLKGEFRCEGSTLAALGRLTEDLSQAYKLRRPVWLAELDLERLVKFPLRRALMRAFSKFPAVERDFSFLVPDQVSYAEIAAKVESLLIPEILSFQPADVFRSASIEPGQYALLLRVVFQNMERTLTAEEINALAQRVVDALAPLGIRLRQ
jgi:phenylalanyl-tRNA synthetase beta chain